MQKEILEKNPSARLRVYAVWFNMFPGDSRSHWSEDLLNDPRVIHRWDAGKLLGRQYGGNPKYPVDDGVVWDSYFLYDADAAWEAGPPSSVSWGYTIARHAKRLRADLLKLLEEAGT